MASTFEALLLSQVGYLNLNTWQPISKQTVGSPVATVTFSALPQTYTHLISVVRAKSASTATSSFSDNLVANFNGVATAHYNYTVIAGNSSSAVSGGFGSGATGAILSALWTSFAPSTAGAGASFNVIPNYTDANFAKMILNFGYAADGGATIAVMELSGGAFSAVTSTAAVTSLSFATNSTANFTANSSFSLYGVP